MATYWLGEGGNDTNDGTTYALRKASTAAALALLTNKGDVLNVVGTVLMGTTNYVINAATLGNRGTSYEDPALIIQGTDADGQPAMCTIASDGSHVGFLSLSTRVNYTILRGIYFDLRVQPSSASVQPLQIIGAGHTPVKLQYCIVEGNSALPNSYYPQLPYATANFDPLQEAGEIEVLVEYCYYKAARVRGANDHTIHVDHCVYYHNTAEYSGPTPLATTDDSTSRWPAVKMTNCTIDWFNGYVPTGGTMFTVFRDSVLDATPAPRNRQCHSNLIAAAAYSQLTVNQVFNSGIFGDTPLSMTGTWGGVVGHNAIVLGTYVSTTIEASTNTDFYVNHYHPDQPNTVSGTELYSTDVRLDRTNIDSIINATAAWTWLDINGSGYDITLPKDYRIDYSAFKTMAYDGGIVGAIQDVVNFSPVVINHVYSATSGVLKEVNASSGLLAGATDADNDVLTVTVIVEPSHGQLTINTTDGSFEYTPNITYTGTDTFTFRAEDQVTWSNTGTVTLNVNNQPPTAADLVYEINEGNQTEFSSDVGLLRYATDADVGQTVFATGVGSPSHGTLVSYNTTTGSFVYRPYPFYTGDDTFVFQVSDGNTLSSTYLVTISVLPIGGTVTGTLVDTAPFFRPTLKVTTEFRMKSTKNREKHHDISNYTKERTWNESTHRVMYVGVSTTVQATLGGIAEAQYMMVETDNDIDVSINDTDRFWSVSKCAAIALGDVTAVYLRNNSATDIAQVIFCAAD